MTSETKLYLHAEKQDGGHYVASQIIENLDEWTGNYEYGDVREDEYQVWEYPSGKIYSVVSDREVDKKQYYATPFSTHGTVWLPQLKLLGVDVDKVRSAYQKLHKG